MLAARRSEAVNDEPKGAAGFTCLTTVRLDEPELALLPVSPEYVADIVITPADVASSETEQRPEMRLHEVARGATAPPLCLVVDYVTMPVGEDPLIVTLHVKVVPTVVEAGEQLTLAVVAVSPFLVEILVEPWLTV